MKHLGSLRSPRRAATAVALVLALSGIVAIGVALHAQRSAPQPTAAAAGSITSPTVPATTPPTTVPKSSTTVKRKKAKPKPPPVKSMAASVPTAVTIPSIGVHTPLIRLGRNADGSLMVPVSFHVAGWYEFSVTPGQIGPTVIVGHVDSKSGPGIFYRLGAMKPGDRVTVNRADGSTATFVITGVREYLKQAFPTLDVYGNTAVPTIRLVTCGGAFDRSTGHYLSNIVAFGHLV